MGVRLGRFTKAQSRKNGVGPRGLSKLSRQERIYLDRDLRNGMAIQEAVKVYELSRSVVERRVRDLFPGRVRTLKNRKRFGPLDQKAAIPLHCKRALMFTTDVIFGYMTEHCVVCEHKKTYRP